MQLYIEGMCTDEVDEWIFINGQKLLASGQEVRSTAVAGAPSQWEVPRVGAPAPEVQATGAVHRRGRVVPRRKQLGKQEMAARAATERARTGRRGEGSPLTRSADLMGVCVCVQGIEVLLQSSGSNGTRAIKD
jgi:hypothetical protein